MKNNGLEVATDLKQQRRFWVIERVGWSVMALLVIAALAGLFGNGPLSKATAAQGSALSLEYERFARYEAPADVKLRIGPELTKGQELRVWVSRRYLEHVEVEQTMPRADVSELQSDRVIYVFKLAQTNNPAEIAFHLRPVGYGSNGGSIGIVGGPELQFSQFVYP